MTKYELPPDDDDVFSTLCAIVIGSVLLLAVLFSCIGCSSVKACPECIPEVEIVEVLKPVASCPAPPEIPTVVLPEYPSAPSELTDEALKEWYAEVISTVKSRESLLLQRNRLLLDVLEGYSAIPE